MFLLSRKAMKFERIAFQKSPWDHLFSAYVKFSETEILRTHWINDPFLKIPEAAAGSVL